MCKERDRSKTAPTGRDPVTEGVVVSGVRVDEDPDGRADPPEVRGRGVVKTGEDMVAGRLVSEEESSLGLLGWHCWGMIARS